MPEETIKQHSSVLFDEEPLLIPPKLAVLLGLNEAIVLQQIHYWIRKEKNEKDSRYWVFNSYSNWQTNFPFWSEDTIVRIIKRLEEKGVLISTSKYNKDFGDRTKWYTIDYDALDNFGASKEEAIKAIFEKAQFKKEIRNAKRFIDKYTKENNPDVGWWYLEELEECIETAQICNLR